jgi:hypothetical protein
MDRLNPFPEQTMPKNLPSDQEFMPIDEDSKDVFIGRQVIKALGSPNDLLKVKVLLVASDRYRVNILTGKDFASGKIANSFFLAVDPKGKILSSTPQILKVY